MKKYLKTFILYLMIFIFFFSTVSFAASNNKINAIKDIDINEINLNSVDKSKREELKNVLENIDIKNLDTASIASNISKEDIESGNIDINSINTNAINLNEIAGIYQDLSEVISNEEIADLIKDNKNVLSKAGVSEEVLSTSETMLRTFDANTVIDIMQNDLDINKIIELYKSGASIDQILSSILAELSPVKAISIAFKLLFSNTYFRIGVFALILICIYSLFITSLIFKKASKHSFATLIPIYRDIVHLKICSMSPWVLLLIFVPVIGWLMLMAIAIICRFELAKNFGHGFFFGLGLLLFPILFRTIIAFSGNEFDDTDYEYDDDED